MDVTSHLTASRGSAYTPLVATHTYDGGGGGRANLIISETFLAMKIA